MAFEASGQDIGSIAEASEVTRPWRTLNISKSLSKGSSNGTSGGMDIRARCYARARSHAYAERRFCARRVARAKQKLAHREAKRNGGFVVA